MSGSRSAALRAQAHQCGRLAKTIYDRETIASLEQTAREVDHEADLIETANCTVPTPRER
jgi:hypothetical protein